MLQSDSYVRPKDLFKDIPFDLIAFEDGIDEISKKLHKRNAINVVSNAYSDFVNLLSTKRGCNENFESFESRFAAADAKMELHVSSRDIGTPIITLLGH